MGTGTHFHKTLLSGDLTNATISPVLRLLCGNRCPVF